jgi:hypothetical protein
MSHTCTLTHAESRTCLHTRRMLGDQVAQPWVTTVDDKDFVRAGGLWTPEVVVTMRMVRVLPWATLRRFAVPTHCSAVTGGCKVAPAPLSSVPMSPADVATFRVQCPR